MNDLISREAAIRKLQDKGEEPRYQHTDEDWKCGLFMAEDIINDLPAAERVGKWIKLYAGNYKCSVCGDWWSNDDNEMVEDFKYCPNCGARMVKGEENED